MTHWPSIIVSSLQNFQILMGSTSLLQVHTSIMITA